MFKANTNLSILVILAFVIGIIFFPLEAKAGGPINELCGDAISIFDGDTLYDNTNAITDGELTTCGGDFGSDIWYIYTATCTGDVTVETCNQADYDTILAFYDGSSCANALDDSSLIICNDDTDGCGDFTSQLTAPVIVAQDYLVRVGGFEAEQGTGTISIVPEQNCTSPSPTPTPLVIIPTMGQWGMIFLTIILGVLAVIGLRRKGSQDT